jgi:hypothetical protein
MNRSFESCSRTISAKELACPAAGLVKGDDRLIDAACRVITRVVQSQRLSIDLGKEEMNA